MAIIRRLVNGILLPVKRNVVFFVVFIFLISQTALKTLLVGITDLKSDATVFVYLCLSAFISYIATALIYLTRSKILKIVFYSIGLLLFGTYMFLWLVFGTSLSPTIIQILGETNKGEASEFINTFVLSARGMASILSVFAAALIIFLMELKLKINLKKSLKAILGGILIFCLCLGLYKSHIYITLLRTKTSKELAKWASDNNPYFPMDIVTTLAYSIHGPVAVRHDIEIARRNTQKVYETKTVSNQIDSTLIVVYILGESYIKQHAAIYGYNLPTTPCLSKELKNGNLFTFTDVISAFNMTTDAEKNTFSLNSLSEGQYWYDYPIFPTVFKHAGFNVYVWDLQRTWDDNAEFTFSVNSYLYDPEIRKLSYSETNKKKFEYDGDLVDDFFKFHKHFKSRNLLVFHLIGQHVDAHKRYPHNGKFEKFGIKDIHRNERWMTNEMRQDIAYYDNATYYNDWVIGKIIKEIENSNAIMVYLSDHGEEIYDYRPSKGRKGSPISKNVQKYQFAIPMVVWCSDKYISLHPEIVNSLRNSLNKPMMSDNVGQLLLHLSGIQTSFYKPVHDIISPEYRQGERMLGNGIKYKK